MTQQNQTNIAVSEIDAEIAEARIGLGHAEAEMTLARSGRDQAVTEDAENAVFQIRSTLSALTAVRARIEASAAMAGD